MNKDTIKQFIKWTEHLAYVEFIESEWQTRDDDEVVWELLEDDEFDYSAEIHNILRKDGFVIVNGDNGCGTPLTYIFEASKEII